MTMPRQGKLFYLPAKPRLVMMHVYDAGNAGAQKVIQFECSRCHHRTPWLVDEKTISKNKRGEPCPKCNEGKI